MPALASPAFRYCRGLPTVDSVTSRRSPNTHPFGRDSRMMIARIVVSTTADPSYWSLACWPASMHLFLRGHQDTSRFTNPTSCLPRTKKLSIIDNQSPMGRMSFSPCRFFVEPQTNADKSLLDNDLHGVDTATPCHSRAEPALDPIGSGNPGHNRNTTDGRPTTAAGRFGGKYAEFSETYVLESTAAIHLPGREQATWPILEAGRPKRQTVQLNSTKSLCRRQCLRGQ